MSFDDSNRMFKYTFRQYTCDKSTQISRLIPFAFAVCDGVFIPKILVRVHNVPAALTTSRFLESKNVFFLLHMNLKTTN